MERRSLASYYFIISLNVRDLLSLIGSGVLRGLGGMDRFTVITVRLHNYLKIPNITTG